MSLGRRRGRILAVKLGFNPNSSSLGVDVTFLLFGLTIVALLTPMISFLLRLRARARRSSPGAVPVRPSDPQTER
jgi:hypothetical protein